VYRRLQLTPRDFSRPRSYCNNFCTAEEGDRKELPHLAGYAEEEKGVLPYFRQSECSMIKINTTAVVTIVIEKLD
jgi:hypothetical protein